MKNDKSDQGNQGNQDNDLVSELEEMIDDEAPAKKLTGEERVAKRAEEINDAATKPTRIATPAGESDAVGNTGKTNTVTPDRKGFQKVDEEGRRKHAEAQETGIDPVATPAGESKGPSFTGAGVALPNMGKVKDKLRDK